MTADERDLSPSSLTLHEVLAEARRQLDGDGPSYQWGHARIMSGGHRQLEAR
jgi:hypothetical protein